MHWAALTLAATLLMFPGCLDDAPGGKRGSRMIQGVGQGAPDLLRTQDRLEISEGSVINIRALGVGWGRLDVLATSNLSVQVAVRNDAFAVSGRQRPETTAYDPGNHTHIYFFGADEIPHHGVGFSMQWWGLPARGPVTNGGDFPQPVSPKSPAVLLMASTVPGFTITLSAGKVDATHDLRWQLGANPAYLHVAPTPTVKPGPSDSAARVQRESDWTTKPQVFQPGMLRAFGWSQSQGQNVQVGAREDVIRIVAIHSPSTTERPSPVAPSTNGAGFSYASLDLAEPGTYEMYRHAKEYAAGMDNEQVGAAFLAIPWHMHSV